MGKLSKKVAVITGGSSGIGLATAKEWAAEGAKRSSQGVGNTPLDALTEIGHGAIGIQGDVANLADLDRLMAEVDEQFGAIDVFFGNAAINILAPIGSVTEDHFDQHFNMESV